jgi:hypothetical protein
MNDKDKEAFEKWWSKEREIDDFPEGRSITCTMGELYRWENEAWQAACEYKDKEYLNGTTLKKMNEKYEQERERSKKLIEALQIIAEISYYFDYGDHRAVATRAIEKNRGEA